MFDKYISQPVKEFFGEKLSQLGEWLKINSLDLLTVIFVVFLVYWGYKAFFFEIKEDDLRNIFIAVMGFTIIRLFWRVILHV
ncbi:MAG: hypothetical protein BWY74_00072 [Firmicutes bacterium ADurb.Bin419]|nr:MAG: hypothetical protein BWY74_00072 [Firmicutes bacterium ADurb.Bin419]